MGKMMDTGASLLSMDESTNEKKLKNPYENTNILVIEDEELMSALVKRYIQSIDLPGTPEKNLKVLDRGWDLLTADLSNVKVAVVDILLPQVTGVDLIKSFRKRFPNMGIIPITGMATEPMRRQLKEILDHDYFILDKPLRRNEFQKAFEKAWQFEQHLEPSAPLVVEEGEQLWTSVNVNENRAQDVPIVRRKLLRKRNSDTEDTFED